MLDKCVFVSYLVPGLPFFYTSAQACEKMTLGLCYKTNKQKYIINMVICMDRKGGGMTQVVLR